MRAAMAAAEVGDEQLGEDPTTRRLEERVATLLGKEAALFLPTGSMCNKVAVAAFTRPGDALVCDHRAHVLRAEGGGAAALSGIVFEPIVTDKGHFTPEQLKPVLSRGNLYVSRTSLVSLEQTHNYAGGTVWPLDRYRAVAALAREHGASTFTDGARVFNAAAASNTQAIDWAAPVDAIWIDFSKGLGGPGGAAIAGSADFVATANRFKYLFGGAMRQSGILAAAAEYGLDHNIERMGEDNENAARLGAGLEGLGLKITQPESNMVFVDPPQGTGGGDSRDPGGGGPTLALITALAKEGVRASAIAGRLRMVTHLGVSRKDIDSAITAFGKVLRG
ncbi:MAG: threonine aldolase family protein, partial [Actinomycetota bacterium]